MAGDILHDPAKALEYKQQGNTCFGNGDYVGAEALYTKAISHDPSNPLLYTNRANALLKMDIPDYAGVVRDSQDSINLLPVNMKAFFFLAQGQIELKRYKEALEAAREAHRLCVEECRQVPVGKGATSITPITELVLRCKKEWWEDREMERLNKRQGLERDILDALKETSLQGREGEIREVFERAEVRGGEERRRKVPDWCIDDITFSVMLDPVVTKTGQSYDRASLMEHLKRSPTDPLTREPLKVEDLRPNLALKEACEAFLEENGWAVDW